MPVSPQTEREIGQEGLFLFIVQAVKKGCITTSAFNHHIIKFTVPGKLALLNAAKLAVLFGPDNFQDYDSRMENTPPDL